MPDNGSNGHNGKSLHVVQEGEQLELGPEAEPIEAAPAPVEEPGPPGLVTCDLCGRQARRSEKGDHLSVHFPTNRATKPCARSWPPKPPAKKTAELVGKPQCVHGADWDRCAACGTRTIP